MAKQATLINEQGNKQVVDVGSQQASSLMGQGYQLMGASGKYTPANQIATPATQNIPTGAVPISGAEYNTGELQKANFSNIQPIGNTLYGIPKAPIVPDIIPQGEFGKSQTPQVLSETQEKAKSMISFTDKQKSELEAANKRLISGTGSEVDKKNVYYAKSRGWVSSPTEEIPEPVKSTTDTLFETMSNLGAIRAKAKEEAMKTTGLDEKSQAIATAQSVANQLRTELQNQGILDIKEQDVIRAKPILTAQIQGQLEGLSREQKLDAMILQNNYNNALVEQEIAQGNYDRAREIVKETADDAYNSAREYIEALKFKAEIEDKATDKLDEELKYERDLALDGYVHIKSTDALKGLREDQIYRDPVSNKIYMKPAPKLAQIIDINGRKVGLDENGNKIRDYGSSLTPEQQLEIQGAGYTINANGNLVPNSGSLLNIDVSQLPNDVISGTPSWAQVLIAEKAKETGVPASLISAVINQESGFNPNASNVSDKERSYGLGQINLNAHPEITKEQATDPGFAINFVANRLKNMINKYGLYEGVQAYNTPGAIGSEQLIRYANNILTKAGANITTTPVSSIAVNWAENIRDGKAKLSDITSEVEKSNPGLKSEVNSILKSLPPSERQINEAQDFVKKLKELKNNSGLKYAVGPNWVTRGGIFGVQGAFGAKDDFLGKAQTLISKKALGALIEAKSQGATFGALSDAELALLKSSGTTLSAWANEKNEKLTGFDVSEKKFKEELDNMITEYEKIITQANGGQSTSGMSEDDAYKLYQQIVNK